VKIFRILLGFIYLAFSFMALPMADCGQAEEGIAHACCCAASGSCSPEMPMDCCADPGEELPQPSQIPATEFSLHVPVAVYQGANPAFQPLHVNLKPQTSNLKPHQGGVKPYIAYHKLIFYA
jgi:hypothetical protein